MIPKLLLLLLLLFIFYFLVLYSVQIKYIFFVWNGHYNILCTRNWLNSEHKVHNIQGKIYFYPVDYGPALSFLEVQCTLSDFLTSMHKNPRWQQSIVMERYCILMDTLVQTKLKIWQITMWRIQAWRHGRLHDPRISQRIYPVLPQVFTKWRNRKVNWAWFLNTAVCNSVFEWVILLEVQILINIQLFQLQIFRK